MGFHLYLSLSIICGGRERISLVRNIIDETNVMSYPIHIGSLYRRTRVYLIIISLGAFPATLYTNIILWKHINNACTFSVDFMNRLRWHNMPLKTRMHLCPCHTRKHWPIEDWAPTVSLFYWRRGQAICIKIPLLLRPFTHAPTWRKLQNTELEYKRATTAFWTTFPIKGKQQFTCCLCSAALVGPRNLPRRCESPYRYQIRAGNLIFLPRSLQWTLCKYQ